MTQVILASTLYQAANLAALVDAGQLGQPDEKRILVVANNSYAPELTSSLDRLAGAQCVLQRFDQIVDWNATIWPSHPKTFGINPTRSVPFQRFLRREWGIENDKVNLLLESLPNDPGACLANTFADSPLSVHSDGLMSYGPIRKPLGRTLWQRLQRLYFTDIVPGLEPKLLTEHSPDRVPLSPDSLRPIFDEMTTEVEPLLAGHPAGQRIENCALILGQYMSDIGLITAEEELQLHFGMVDAAIERGCTTVVFKPHPTAAKSVTGAITQYARSKDIEFVVADVPVLAEVLVGRIQPSVVISCFSTGLATARRLYGSEVVSVGTELLLESIKPYENSNRIPLTLVDALYRRDFLPPIEASKADGERNVQHLVDAVAYCMQPETLETEQGAAAEFLTTVSDENRTRYFKRRRLTALDLPGRLPPRVVQLPPATRVRRLARRLRKKSTRLIKRAVA